MAGAANPLTPVYGNDKPFLYNVAPWNQMGFAVPNWGAQIGTKNVVIHRLVDEIGKHQLNVMTHEDAMRAQYPSINTVLRLAHIFNRAQTLLSGRQKTSTDLRVEQVHADAGVYPWILHPVPYYRSSFIINPWLTEYNTYTFMILTNMLQYSENNLSMTITSEFAAHIWQFFREIGTLVASELLGMPSDTAEAPGFQFTDDMVKTGYATIAQRTLSIERLCTPGPIQSTATEVDLGPLFRGFPTTHLISCIAQYPVDLPSGLGYGGTAPPISAQPIGVSDGTQVAPPGGEIGSPQV